MQFFLKKPKTVDWPDRMTLEIDGAPVEVGLRVHARARTYRLSLSDTGRAVLTVPVHGDPRTAGDFLDRQRAWLGARLSRVSGPRPFADGATFPLRGVAHRIHATGRLRGGVAVDADETGPVLLVPGAPEHLNRRLTDWLKTEADNDLQARVAVHAATLGVTPSGITLRGQSSRWGSCSSRGRLSFNWRLVLAPPFVLDYVAAHEVAHLRHMNHSPAFWAEVARALPDHARGRAWLRSHGRELMVHGRPAS
ncbi:MAG: M48 family metallopeptidase [Alphaproteobacteria bacterium]|nr:M48 family metallopeptidase [Alphaproteobacteria bacterium]